MDPSAAGAGASRQRAEQFLSVAEKLLVARDLEGCKQFSSQALATDPNTPGAEDLHAAASVLLAAERRRLSNGQPDPYAVLGLDPSNPSSRHPDAVHSHFRRLSFLLNRSRPDGPFSLAFTNAARLVADAWGFLTNSALKSALDANIDAAAAEAAAVARAYHSPPSNRSQSQSSLPARPNPPSYTSSPRPTPQPAVPTPPGPVAPSPRPTPPLAAPSPRPTLPRAALAPQQTPPPVFLHARPTPPPVVPPPRPQPPPVTSPPRSTPATVVSPPRSTPPAAGPQTRPTPPARAPQTPQTPAAATVPPAASNTPPSSTFWTVCTACRHIHQYDRLYEKRKLLCPSCRQSFVAEALAEPPPIVPGTDMYYCTWGFFPVGFPGCPGFERLVSSQPQGPDQLNAPWLTGNAGVKGNGGDTGVKGNAAENAENGVSVSAGEDISVDVPATTPPAKPVRIKVAAKKRGRPKGSKNKNKM